MMTPEMYKRKDEIEIEISNMLAEEEISWLQWSHEKWLLKGDNNPAYFHRIVNGRKRKINTIHNLNSGDDIIEGTNNLLLHATECYKTLFGPAP